MNADSVVYSLYIGIKDLISFFTGDLGRNKQHEKFSKISEYYK